MKNYLKLFVAALLVLVATGCGSKSLTKNSSVEDLLNVYMEGLKNGDPDKVLSTFPDFARDYYKKYITEESIKEGLERYGDNLELSYKITKNEKMTDDELDKLNTDIKSAFTNYVLPSECNIIEGTTTTKGSKDEYTGKIEMWYCNFDGTWRLLGD